MLRDDPGNTEALIGRAVFKYLQGRINSALADLRRASDLAPDHPSVFQTLGEFFMRQSRLEEAIVAFRQALRVVPSSPSTHANLALLLARVGQTGPALAQYRIALGLRPDHAGWLADLAWMLATQEDPRFRDPVPALRLAEQACGRTENGDPRALEALAAAQAANARFRAALATARLAVQLAKGMGQGDLVKQNDTQIQCYQKEKPFRARAPLHVLPYTPVPPLTVKDR